MTLCTQILVTEDNDDTREMMVRFLRTKGYRVDSAANGAEALRKLRNSTGPTLILLDLMMPVMDGWDFLKVSSRGEHKVVTTSAVHADTLDDSFAGVKVDGILQKPLFAKDIIAVAEKFCGPPPASKDVEL